MKLFSTLGLVVLIGIAAAALAFWLAGPDRFWRYFGDPDLGPVAFETLERRTSPNDALACPDAVCAATADITTTLYPVPAKDLRAAFAPVIAMEPRIDIIASDDTTMTDRYIQRSATLGFPDTIVVQFFDRADGQSTLALYSRSQLGQSDLGANKQRIERWLEKLAARVPAVGK